VTNFGCRLAKHRGGDTLEVRDLQLHLGTLALASSSSSSPLLTPPPSRVGGAPAHYDYLFTRSSVGSRWHVLTVTDRAQSQHSYSWIRIGHATHRAFAGRGGANLPDRTKCQKGRSGRAKLTPFAPPGPSSTGQTGGQAHVESISLIVALLSGYITCIKICMIMVLGFIQHTSSRKQ
jgi:hypothetical protein